MELMKNGTPPMSFFEDEVRDGFLIPSMMKRLWAFNMQSYHVLEALCEKHGVHCSVIFGSMLGAIRHGGFVPWDDDMDVEMLRESYLPVEKDAREGRLPGDYHIGDYITDYGENMVRRWMTGDSLVEPFEKWKDHYGFPFVCIMDIFLQDYLPTEESEKKQFWDVMERAGELRSRLKDIDNKTASKQFSTELRKIEWDLGCRFDYKSEMPIPVQIMMGMDSFCLNQKEKGWDHIGETAFTQNNPSRVIPKELYEHYVKIRFEFGEVTVPAGYDGVMRRNFGDYMVPVLNFGIHAYPIYQTMNKDAKRVAGFELSSYRYDPERIRELRLKRREMSEKAVPLADEIRESIQMFGDAHVYIREHFSDDPDTVAGLIGQCQDLAIQIGESIEAHMMKPENAVSVLEKYCEHIFALYQMLIGGDEMIVSDSADSQGNEGEGFEPGASETDKSELIMRMCEQLSEFETRMDESVSELSEKKKAVFLPYRPANWKGMHTMWQQAVRDGWDVTVIAVPYYYKDFEQKVDKEHMICETEGYPEEVLLTPYDAYDFEKNHPDKIICQYPYDEYGGALVLHPFYYMSNLYPYTEEMVLVPPFQLREIGASDVQPRYTWGTYLRTPGVMLADTFYVQSENMKNITIDLIKEMIEEDFGKSGNGSRGGAVQKPKEVREFVDSEIEGLVSRIAATDLPAKLWEEKCRILIRDGDGNIYLKSGEKTDKTVYDDIISLPDEMIKKLKKTGDTPGFKKILLYRLGGSVCYEHGVDEVNRAEKALRLMESRSEKLLPIWMEDPYVRDILEKNRPEVWQAYIRVRDEYVKRDIGVMVYAEEKSVSESGRGYVSDDALIDDLIRVSDAYFGDACAEMNEMRRLGKPVMWATPGTEIGGQSDE